MKTFMLIFSSITVLMLLSTMICGLWMRAQKEVDPSSIAFHSTIAVASVIFALAAIVLLLLQVVRHG